MLSLESLLIHHMSPTSRYYVLPQSFLIPATGFRHILRNADHSDGQRL